MIKQSFIALAALIAASSFAAEKVLFKETFDSPESLKKWRIDTPADGSQYSIENGALSILHKHKPGVRSYMEIPIPRVNRGKLEFDVLIDPDHADPRDRIGLTVSFYNIAAFWHDSCKDWRSYFPEPETQRIPFFYIEPVGHKRISILPKYKYVHYKILFDHQADMVEFYAEDMLDPKSARYDVSIWGQEYYMGTYLKLGSYAYTTDSYRTLVDNVVFTEITEEKEETASVKNDILVFDGLGTVHYPMGKLLKGHEYRAYSWVSPGYNPSNTNNYAYEKSPGYQKIKDAKLFVFNDGPNIAPALQKQIVKAVKDGSDLIILSGLASLGKGGFKGSVLEQIMPVTIGDLWSVKGHHETPILLDEKDGLVPAGSILYYYWDVKPVEGAEVMATADHGKIPVLIRKQFGKGTVTVLAATAFGQVKPNSFWNTEFIQNIFKTIPALK